MDNLNFLARRTLHHGHRARFELPAIFHCSYESAPGHHLSSDRHFLGPIHHRPLLRVRGRTLSIHADMPTMNIHISLKFHAVCAASKVLQNYNDLGLKEITINKINNNYDTKYWLGTRLPYKTSFHSSPGQLQIQHCW